MTKPCFHFTHMTNKELARNSSLYTFGNPGLDHKSSNQALFTSFKLSFYLPHVLPEECSNRRADTEYSMASSHPIGTAPRPVGRSPSHGIALSSNLGSGRNSVIGPSFSSPCCLVDTSLKSNGNISGFLTQGILAMEVRE